MKCCQRWQWRILENKHLFLKCSFRASPRVTEKAETCMCFVPKGELPMYALGMKSTFCAGLKSTLPCECVVPQLPFCYWLLACPTLSYALYVIVLFLIDRKFCLTRPSSFSIAGIIVATCNVAQRKWDIDGLQFHPWVGVALRSFMISLLTHQIPLQFKF